MDKQQFFNGAVFDAWRWFGAHLGGGGAVFRTFAPNASRITLTGAMNGWTETDLASGRPQRLLGGLRARARRQGSSTSTASTPPTAP